jgi:hypothetical protein
MVVALVAIKLTVVQVLDLRPGGLVDVSLTAALIMIGMFYFFMATNRIVVLN